MEIELKLLFSPADLRALPAHACVREHMRVAHRSVVLHSIYFDTPEGDLRNRGIALRLRRERGRWIQTLKGPGEAVAGLHSRGEFEWRVPREALDPGLLAQTPHVNLFQKRRVRETLAPVFTTGFRRRVIELKFADDTEAGLCLDAGEIRAGGRVEPISEAEIEIVRGDPRTLIGFAIDLSQTVPFRLGHSSKAERAWQLALGEPARPRKAARIELDADAAAAQSAVVIISACLSQIGANSEGAIAGKEPEFLHQLRVGLRRLRVALALIRDERWRKAIEPEKRELEWLSSVLGPARNWDVFVTELLPPIACHCGYRQVASLRARAAAQRRRHGAAASEAIASPRFAAFCLRLASMLIELQSADIRPQPLPEGAATAAPEEAWIPDVRRFSADALERRRRKLLSSAPGDPRPATEALHRLRIEAKKLRYTAEFFASLYPGRKLRRHVRSLAALQTVLGEANDTSVAQRMIEQAAQAGAKPLAPELRGLAQGWIAATEARARDAYGAAWKSYVLARTFW